MKQINIIETQNLISQKESIISQMNTARIEAKAKRDSLASQYMGYTEEFKSLMEKAKPILGIEGDISESETLSILTEKINSLIEELNTSIPNNL